MHSRCTLLWWPWWQSWQILWEMFFSKYYDIYVDYYDRKWWNEWKPWWPIHIGPGPLPWEIKSTLWRKELVKNRKHQHCFLQFFFTSNSDYTNTKTLTCPPPSYHTMPANSPMSKESAPYWQIMLLLLFFASFPLSLMSLFSSVWLLLSETRQKVLGEFLVGRWGGEGGGVSNKEVSTLARCPSS